MNQVLPFWMLNDLLTKEGLISQLEQFKQIGLNQIIVHPRYGLRTKYLSKSWFKAIKIILEWSGKNNFKIWIYDELNWPSGYAGGYIIKKDPNLIGKCLVKTKNGCKEKKIDWLAAYSKYHFTDLLDPKTSDLFISLVYDQYYINFKNYFGKTLIGFFTDEPGLYCNFACHDLNTIPWSRNFYKSFKDLNGYSLKNKVDSLWIGKKSIDIQRRVDYWRTISYLYQNNYFKKLQQWCHSRKVQFVGHLLAEESIINTIRTQGDFFGVMKYFDWAGYDLLSKLDRAHIVTAKLALSAKYNYGLKKVCAETFGVFGENLNIDKMQKVTQWQINNGLDVSIPHAFFYSIKGKRKFDCPPSFFNKKYLNSFNKFVEFTKNTKIINDPKLAKIAVYYPKETVWGELLPNDKPDENITEKIFNDVVFSCYNLNQNFNIIDEEVINNNLLKQYKVIILPNVTITNLVTLKRLKDFSQKHNLLVIGNPPVHPTKSKDLSVFNKETKNLNYKKIEYITNNTNPIITTKDKFKNALKKKIPLIALLKIKTILEKITIVDTENNIKKRTPIEIELADYLRNSFRQ